MHFHCETICSLWKQSVGGALKVLAKPLKTVFNEDNFIVNLVYQISIKMAR